MKKQPLIEKQRRQRYRPRTWREMAASNQLFREWEERLARDSDPKSGPGTPSRQKK